MKAVLISIQPKWVEKIANGEKTIEVRKTAPKQVPFKCYIYCTKAKKQDDIIWAGVCGDRGAWNEHIIGEFVCDKIITVDCDSIAPFNPKTNEYIDEETCLNRTELIRYTNHRKALGWHISDLKIYDKPKELSEFRVSCPTSCENCKNPLYYECWCEEKGVKVLTRAPQSWQYVEEL